MIIEVTQQDIDDGIRGGCYNCPIAKAMTRQFGKPVVVALTHWD